MIARLSLLILICLWGSSALAEQRLALIITNADYPVEIGRLAKTHDDGRIIATALKDVGFNDVHHVRDADFQAMRLELANFVERIERAGPNAVIFFYYSGHGAADRVARGENYLIPTQARIKTAKQLPLLGLGLGEIVKTLERVPAKARFVVIDACRNVAFTKGLKNAAKGFVPMRRLDGILLAFATRPGETAEDAGFYSRALARHLRQPGIPPERVFKLTQLSVAEASKGNQVPWIEDGLLVRGFQFKVGQQLASAAPAIKPVFPKQEPEPACDGVNIRLATGRSVCIKPGSGESFKDCDVCPEMAVVPAGSFTMGAAKTKLSNPAFPPRKVVISEPISIGVFEVTWKEWNDCANSGGCASRLKDHGWGKGRRPVIGINWNDAKAYVAWLRKKSGKSYRLPSESEWEYVARAGTKTDFPWGSKFDNSRANIGQKTVPVGSYPPNSFGLHDTHGNVWEWVEDCVNKRFERAPSDGSAWLTGNCRERVLRGGSWGAPPGMASSTYRFWYKSTDGDEFSGFRVARDIAN